LGIKAYNSSGQAGTAFAHDLPDGSVRINVVTAANAHFSIAVEDPQNALSAASFTAGDFIFA
jgi:predicted aconitase